MKLNRIKLQNFRCFESLEIEFDPRLTVIVAENGIGKTTILDAIATGFGRFLTKLPLKSVVLPAVKPTLEGLHRARCADTVDERYVRCRSQGAAKFGAGVALDGAA